MFINFFLVKIIELIFLALLFYQPHQIQVSEGFRVVLGFVTYLYVAVLKKVRFFCTKLKTVYCLQLPK